MNGFTRLIAVVPILAGLGYASAVAVSDGTSGDTVEWVKRQWLKGAPTEQDRIAIVERLERARDQVPGSPWVHEMLGLMALRGPEYASQAGVHFRKALELRPGSAFTWGNLATWRYRVGDTGREFEMALMRAARLGPYEPQVQATVANYGLAVWPEAGPELRTEVERVVKAGMRRNALEMLQIAQRRGRLEVACPYLAGTPRQNDTKWSQLCQSLEAT